MWPQSYFPQSYMAAHYWPKGFTASVTPPPTGQKNQNMLLLGIGTYLLLVLQGVTNLFR